MLAKRSGNHNSLRIRRAPEEIQQIVSDEDTVEGDTLFMHESLGGLCDGFVNCKAEQDALESRR